MSSPFNARLERFCLNPHGRDVAVGDIHGNFSMLEQGLKPIGFDPVVDRLFSLGDLADRGPESHRVGEWLAQPWFHAVSGNHDLMTWRSALGNPIPVSSTPSTAARGSRRCRRASSDPSRTPYSLCRW